MKTFDKFAAQGDVFFRRLPDDYKIPTNATKVEPVNGYIEVAHSETGHNHVMEMDKVSMWAIPDNYMKTILVVNEDTELQHLRSFDTHESILFGKGTYEVRRQRAYVPEGWRRVED